MSTTTQRKIDGQGRSVKELLFSRKYSIDYYQREYKWQTKQVKELIDDLVETFEEHHKPGNERRAVKGYGHSSWGPSSSATRTARSSSSTGNSGSPL